MAVTVIKYLPKQTSAGTEYRECSEEDLAMIINTCIHIQAVMSEYDTQRDADSVWVREQWWHKRTDTLHRGQRGLNTPCSFIGGIVYNMMFKQPQQRDLTDKQQRDLETITAVLHSVRPEIPALRFQIGLG